MVHRSEFRTCFLLPSLQQPPNIKKWGNRIQKKDPGYEGRIALAIDALKNEKISELRCAARLYDVSLSTLRRCLNGTIPASDAGILC